MKYFSLLHSILPSSSEIDLSADVLRVAEDSFSVPIVDLAQAERMGFAVSPTIIVSSKLISEFYNQKAVGSLLSRELNDLWVDDPSFHVVAKKVRKIVASGKLWPAVQKELLEAWNGLTEVSLSSSHQSFDVLISTDPSQDLLFGSHACKIKVFADLEKAFIEYLALQFEDSVLHLRYKETGSYLPEAFAFMIQIVGKHTASGSAYCYDLDNPKDENTISVVARYSGSIDGVDIDHGDRFKVDKKSLILMTRLKSTQKWTLDPDKKHTEVADLERNSHVLDDQKVILLARKTRVIQSLSDSPVKVSWLWNGNQFVILNISTPQKISSGTSHSGFDFKKPVLIGKPGVVGICSGPVRIIRKAADKANIQKGDIVVVEGLVDEDQEWVYKARGVISEASGFDSVDFGLCSKYSTELVMGCSGAPVHLMDGQYVTINGATGFVYSGVLSKRTVLKDKRRVKASLITGTKVCALMNESEVISPSDISIFDGVGLLRAEHLLSMVGLSQEDLIRRKMAAEYVEMVVEHLLPIVQMAYPKPVIYQMHDCATSMMGSSNNRDCVYEANPKMGHRGALKYINNPELFELEIAVVDQFLKMGYTNFGLMIPMLRTRKEGEEILKMIKKAMKDDFEKISIWLKCETPAMMLSIQRAFILPITGICFDVCELGQLMFGVDYGNARIGHNIDDESGALADSLSIAISKCRKAGVSTSLVSEGVELSPEILETSVRAGLNSVVVQPASEIETRHLLASIEKRMMLDHLVDELNA